MAEVSVVSRKWNGDFHRRTPGVELGTDAAGTWLWMPERTVAETPSGTYNAIPGLRLLPIGRMWSAYFVPSDPLRRRPRQLYVDITTPTTRAGDVIEFIDLDLDVEQFDDGEVRVLDRDEFEEHAREWAYPAALVDAAEEACRSVVTAATRATPPFDGSYVAWWQRATSPQPEDRR